MHGFWDTRPEYLVWLKGFWGSSVPWNPYFQAVSPKPKALKFRSEGFNPSLTCLVLHTWDFWHRLSGSTLGHRLGVSLSVRVPINHILTQNLYYDSYYPKPKYLITGYLDPLRILQGARFPPLTRVSALISPLIPFGHPKLSKPSWVVFYLGVLWYPI